MKRSIESSDSEVNQSKDVLSLDKKPKKAMKKKSKKLDSDDEEAEEFTTSAKAPPPHSEPKRTRKSQGRGKLNDDDADLKLALELSLAETNQNKMANNIVVDEDTSDINTAPNGKEVEISLNVSKQSDSKKSKKSPNSAAKKSNKKQKKEINDSDLSNKSDDDFENKKKKPNEPKKPKEPKKAKETKEPKKAKEPKSAKKKTPASNKKKVISDLDDDKPDQQENKENTFKKSLDFAEQKPTIPVEAQIKHVEPIEEKEDEEEQIKTDKKESEEELDEETREEVPKVEIVKASKILALNQASNISSKPNVNSKFNSPAINHAIEQGRADAKLTPTIVRIGLSRNSKIKPLHPNAKPTF